MPAIRLYNVAKACDLESKELIKVAQAGGIDWVERASDLLEEATVKQLLEKLKYSKKETNAVLKRLDFKADDGEFDGESKARRVEERRQRSQGAFILPEESADDPPPMNLDAEFRLAEEKAQYFESLAKNAGVPPFRALAEQFRTRAEEFDEQAAVAERKGSPELAVHLRKREKQNRDLATRCEADAEETEQWGDDRNDHERAQDIESATKCMEFWRSIHKLSPEDTAALILDRQTDPSLLFVLAQKNSMAVRILAQRGHVGHLIELVQMGNSDAAEALVNSVEESVKQLNAAVRMCPSVFLKFAKHRITWPVIHSEHPILREDAVGLMASISCGKSMAFCVDGAYWDPSEAWCRIAMALYYHLQVVRENVTMTVPYAEKARALGRFSRLSSDAWWSVAREAFLLSYPNPEDVSVLKALVTDATSLKYPSRTKQRILERIKTRFLKLAR